MSLTRETGIKNRAVMNEKDKSSIVLNTRAGEKQRSKGRIEMFIF